MGDSPRNEFQNSFELAVDLTDCKVQLRGQAETRFPEYEKDKRHKKFKKVATVAIDNPEKILSLRTALLRANYIIHNFAIDFSCPASNEENEDLIKRFKDFQPQNMDAADEASKLDQGQEPPPVLRLPTLTFGDLMIPVRFTKGSAVWDAQEFERKYIKLHEFSCKNKILELITKVWGIHLPNLVLSFSGCNIDDVPEEIISRFAKHIFNFSKSVGVWILTDGMHSGISRLIGRIFHGDLMPDLEDIVLEYQRDVAHIGIGDWNSLDDPTLLEGISVEGEYHSYYFYPQELEMMGNEKPSMLNPYQDVYLLFQMVESSPVEMRYEFLNQMKICQKAQTRDSLANEGLVVMDTCHENMSGKDNSSNDPFFAMSARQDKITPSLTYVIGGDASTVKQIKMAVKYKMPVIIIHKSGPIPQSLVEIYWKLEKLFPRYCVYAPGFEDGEKKLLSELLEREEHKCLFEGNEKEEVLSNMELIMRYRYFISILDFDEDREKPRHSVVQAMYKPFHREQCISIALEINRLSFLKAVFNREEDPEFDSGSWVSAKILSDLHGANLYENASIFEVNDMAQKKVLTSDIILPLVGKILHRLLGPRYRLLYQEGGSYLDEALISEPYEQYWHLFLYCILSNKLEFAEYLLTLTRSPIGCALLASKLLKYMTKMASRALENEKAVSFTHWSERFEDVALSIVDEIYKRSRRRAYVSINRELPNELGPYITPLSVADDSHAMKFMSSSCCQTYLQRVWIKNMLLTHRDRLLMPFLASLPIINLPILLTLVKFEKTETPEEVTIKDDEDELSTLPSSFSASKLKKSVNSKYRSFLNTAIWKTKSFHTAPITKYNLSIISYVLFLGIISYFFTSVLAPVHDVRDISWSEWCCYIWVSSLILEEIVQVVRLQETGPMFNLERKFLQAKVWSIFHRIGLVLRLYRPAVYLYSGSWNALDIVMLSFYCFTTFVRFVTPDENFQLVRVLYGFSIIVFYYRVLRYLYTLRVIGPRIIAIKLMFVELMMFMVILLVFLLSFGIAFQGLLHPQQTPSFTVLADILWRPYWAMFGQIYIDDGDVNGMGREVSNSSCIELVSQNGFSHLECYSYMPIVLMAIYLAISNILLLNLLIAIFGNTLNKIEESSEAHWKFNQYNLVFEYYYKTWLPPPLSIICHLCLFCRYLYRAIMRKVKKEDTIFSNDHFRMNSVQDDNPPKQSDMFQREAFAFILKMEAYASDD